LDLLEIGREIIEFFIRGSGRGLRVLPIQQASLQFGFA
jgi:hypothetical protein